MSFREEVEPWGDAHLYDVLGEEPAMVWVGCSGAWDFEEEDDI
jgi:hypothetical protein